MPELYLISTLRSAPGKSQQLREILSQTASRTALVEKGCLTFVLTETEQGCDTDVVEFKIIERWASSDDLAEHTRRDWLQQMYRTFEEQKILAEPERIDKLTFLSGFVSR